MICWLQSDITLLSYVTEFERKVRQLEEFKATSSRTSTSPRSRHHSTSPFGLDSLPDRNFKHGLAYVADDDDFGDILDRDDGYGDPDYDADGLYDDRDTFGDVPDGYDQSFEDGGAESDNIEGYDECFSKYVGARKHMNALPLSRSLFPIVAIAGGPQGCGRGSPTPRGKGKGRPTPKGKGKAQCHTAIKGVRPRQSWTYNQPGLGETTTHRMADDISEYSVPSTWTFRRRRPRLPYILFSERPSHRR